MKEHYIISDYCISCDGEVASVGLFSDVPLNKIEKILLDYQSRTSVELLKILVEEYWKIDPVLKQQQRISIRNFRNYCSSLDWRQGA